MEYDFTANLEEQLDRVSAGEINWKDVLRDFWKNFTAALEDIKELRVTNVLDALNDILAPHIFPPREDGGDARGCPSCGNGQLSLKLGKFGSFIGCSNYPECKFTRPMSPGAEGAEAVPAEGVLNWASIPKPAKRSRAATGRFGPYLQLGEAVEGEKPQPRLDPQGHQARGDHARRGAAASVAAARSRHPSRNQQADRRQFRPLRTFRAA